MGVLDYSTTPASNTAINGIGIQGTNQVLNFDNALRQLMADIAAGIVAGSFSAHGYVAKSAGYTVVAADRGKVIDCTATLELDLTAAATLGAGFCFIVKANGGDVTLDPNSTENINGSSSSYVVPNGASVLVVCTGTAWHTTTDTQIPVGTLMDYAGSSAPTGWLLCYGQAISRTTYAALFAILSTTYGVGDGSTTFNLPDLRGRVVAGKDDMGGSSANRLTDQTGGLNGDTLGASGGAETHALTEAQLAAHTHTFSATTNTTGSHGHPTRVSVTASGESDPTGGLMLNTSDVSNYTAHNSATPADPAGDQIGTAGDHAHTVSGTSGSTGSGTAHNNVQPTFILNKIIKF